MNAFADHQDRLLILAGSVCNETASEEDWLELDALIRGNEEMRRRYVEYFRIHAALRLEMQAHSAAKKACQTIHAMPGLCKAQPSDDELHLRSVSPPISTNSPFLGVSGYFSSGWPVAYLVATVAMAIGLTIAAVTHVSQPQQFDQQLTSSNLPVPLPNPSQKSSVVGQITGMVDCVWSEGSGNSTNLESEIRNLKSLVSLRDRFALRSGLLEITYETGAKVILQGPVTYEVESAAGGYLSIGKLTARLDERAKQQAANLKSSPSTTHSPLFTIKTPTAVITDLGTEFGVRVDELGGTESEVFVGRVSIVSLGDSATDRKNRPRIVESGQYARVERENTRLVSSMNLLKSEKPDFVRRLPIRQSDYANLVLAMNPVVYYRMEWPQANESRYKVNELSQGKHHGELHLANESGAMPWWPGRFGSSLYLRGPAVGDYIVVSDYPKSQNDQLSLSAWVNAETRSPLWSLIAANWGMDVHGQFHFGLEAEGDLTIEITPRDRKKVLVREGRDHPLPTGEWQHVAFVVDSSKVRLYRNGIEAASGPCHGVLPQSPLPNLIIGNKNSDGGGILVKPPLHWHGRIDEFAIFNQALRPEQVRALYEGRPAERNR